jgi:hypothetical protein
VIRCPVRLVAVCLALIGQLAGAFGLPAVSGSVEAADAACGCCPADRTAGRCCCTKPAVPVPDEPAPCCRGKKASPSAVVWIIPTLRSKCHDPHDTAPGPVAEVGVLPAAPAAWSPTRVECESVSIPSFDITFRRVPPDDPPPRAG